MCGHPAVSNKMLAYLQQATGVEDARSGLQSKKGSSITALLTAFIDLTELTYQKFMLSLRISETPSGCGIQDGYPGRIVLPKNKYQ